MKRRVLLVLLLLGALYALAGSAPFLADAAPPRAALAHPMAQSTPPASTVLAVVAVDRANVFPAPDRTASPLTYLYERERVPVLGQTADGTWLLTQVDDVQGWILRAQVDLEGPAASIPVITTGSPVTPTLTITPFPAPATSSTNNAPGAPATRTPLSTRTAVPAMQILTPTTGPPLLTTTPVEGDSATPGTPDPANEIAVLPGKAPPITITLPENWNSVDLVVPYRTFDDTTAREVPLTIYFGSLPDGSQGFIYLYWGFPNTVNLSNGEYNLWADGAQILRFSLVGADCNLGVYDQRTFAIGDFEGVGAYYQAADCPEEADTAGWFAALRMYEGGFAFFVAVEPPEALTSQRDYIQQILDTVTFVPAEEE